MVNKKTIETITQEVLENNKTNNLVQVKKDIKEMLKNIEKSIKKNKIDAKIILGGSSAKGTFIGNDFDIDIFVMFDYNKYKDKDLSKSLKVILKDLKPVLVHGSRDYFQINKRFEIIPVLKIKDPKDALNVTDASPLHVKWVEKSLKKTKNKNIQRDIKLTKIFFKSSGVYGAESYIKGFSGHVTDILTIYYGSFIKTIQAISKWKNETEIDIEKHNSFLDISKTQGPLTIIDPVQPDRNAAAALGEKCYKKIIKETKSFLKKPHMKYFEIEEFNLKKIQKTHNIVLKVKPLNGKTDIVGAKLMKGYEFLKKEIKVYEIKRSGWYWDKNKTCYYYYSTKKEELPKEYIQTGPTPEYKDHIENFKNKYKKAYFENDRWYAKVKRPITHIEKEIKLNLDDEQLTLRNGGCEIVK